MREIGLWRNGSALSTLAWLHAPAAAETVLKFASFVPTQYILHKPVFLKLGDDLAAATGGAVKMKVYAAGALGKGPVEQYQRAVRRIAEISYGLPGYTSSAFPKTLADRAPRRHRGARGCDAQAVEGDGRPPARRVQAHGAAGAVRHPARGVHDARQAGADARRSQGDEAARRVPVGGFRGRRLRGDAGADAGDQGLHLDEHGRRRRRADGRGFAADLQADRDLQIRHDRPARDAHDHIHGDERGCL